MAVISETRPAASPQPIDEAPHGKRIFVTWLILSAIAVPLVYFVWGPHLPPNGLSDQSAGQQFDNRVLASVATPVVILVCTFLVYALIFWRQDVDADEIVDGPPLSTNNRLSAGWVLATGAIVLSLAVFGTYELVKPDGAGAGAGPNPIWNPGGKPFPIQVIAQQWRFTYRYPMYGGMESTSLMVPQGVELAIHVTSLDVIHSFWAYRLGVKADANPGVDNVAYVKATKTGTFDVRCAELCGVWHGAMNSPGAVMSAAAFKQWATTTEAQTAAVTKLLPKYAPVYSPDEGGAGGNFYGPQYPVTP
jgi:cytochrome c oxidase subunit II